LISWKYSLEKIIGELELAKKKKDALEKLFSEEKVSQPTFDSFTREIDAGIAEIEERQTQLVQKMRNKISELEEQMRLLEVLLVNSEIRRVSGEIEEETYSREHTVLSLGLDATKGELAQIKDAITSLGHTEPEALPSEPEASPPEVTEETHTLGTEETPEAETSPDQRIEIIMDTGSDDDEATVPQQPSEEAAEEHAEPVQPEYSEPSEVDEAPVEEPSVESTPTEESEAEQPIAEETVTEEPTAEEIFTPFQNEETTSSETPVAHDEAMENPVEPLQDITEEETGY
jgi:hypothetical protein